jgi:hypothetical protein
MREPDPGLPLAAAEPAVAGPGLAVAGAEDYGDYDDYGRSSRYDREGGYAIVTGMYSIEQFDSIPITFGGSPVDSTVDDSVGAGLRLGYRFDRTFAAELAIERQFGHEVSIRVGGPFGTLTEDLETWNYGVQGKAYLSGGSTQPYALLGFGYTESEFANLDESGEYVRIGTGVEFYLEDDAVLLFEASWNTGGEIGGVELDRIDLHVGLLFWF